ncbi:MAG: Ig-like domain-containing protein [Promethearchaeota archaeon]
MKSINKRFKIVLLVMFVSSAIIFASEIQSFALGSKNSARSTQNNMLSLRSVQVTDVFNDAVARYEVDYFQIDNVEPGLMEVSVSWGNSYDIDCYICETPDYTNYLARGYTTNNPETCSYNIQTSGTYYVAVRMYSRWASSTAYTLTVKYYKDDGGSDTAAPTISITSPNDQDTVSGTVSITVDASDNVGVTKVQCNIDGGTWTDDTTSPYEFSWDTTAVSDGSHIINARAYDAAGNYADDSITVTVNNDPSDVVHVSRDFSDEVAGYEVDYFDVNAEPGLMDVSVSWGNSYDIDCYICETADYTNYLARGYTTNNPETCSYTITTAGTYYIAIRMYTSSASSTAYTATVGYYTISGGDYEDPVVSITAPNNGATIQDTVTIEATATDNVGVSKTQCKIDDGAWTDDLTEPYSWIWDTTTASEGTHTITVRAYDEAGNYGEDSITVTVDNVPSTGGKYALIVGISDYKAISDLSYCDEDASDWYNYLTQVCGYSSENVIVLGDGHTTNYPKYDGIATESNIKNYLQWLAGKDGEVAYITSGHGSGDGSGSSYICAWDCSSGEDGEDGDLYDTEVAGILDDAVADSVFIFIDHCYSGGFGPDFMNMPNSNNVYCTTTCSDSGYGYDDSTHQNGMWTYYFLEYTLIDHYGSNPSTTMEDAFDYALSAYPKSGADTPEEYDGNTSGLTTL